MPSILMRGEWSLEKVLDTLYSGISSSSTEPEVTLGASPDDKDIPPEGPVVFARENNGGDKFFPLSIRAKEKTMRTMTTQRHEQ